MGRACSLQVITYRPPHFPTHIRLRSLGEETPTSTTSQVQPLPTPTFIGQSVHAASEGQKSLGVSFLTTDSRNATLRGLPIKVQNIGQLAVARRSTLACVYPLPPVTFPHEAPAQKLPGTPLS